MFTPWYLEQEAKELLIRVGVEGLTRTRHRKDLIRNSVTWNDYHAPLADAIKALHTKLFETDIPREELIARGAQVYPVAAIEFAMGAEIADDCTRRPADFDAILTAVELAKKVAA